MKGEAPSYTVLETLFQNEHLVLSKFAFSNRQRQFFVFQNEDVKPMWSSRE